MAKRGLKKGRWIVFGGLLVFVLVAAAVIARRSYGHRDGLAITELNRRKATLESERVRLTQQIRDRSSRSVIVPIAEKDLHMHIAADSQVVMLSRARANSDAH
jgi:cell division protein FtsL